jgi:hypothetical protein
MRTWINAPNQSFGVDICTDSGQNVLLSENLSSTGYAQVSEWTNITIPFRATQPLADFEVRAVCFPGKIDIYLDYLDVGQINPDG